MIRRLARDESGVVLGLAIVIIVLIGVMGAGLLVFVRNDLEAVVESNQGRRALEIADAGAQAARLHLISDKERAHYDVDSSGDSDYINAGCNISTADESTAPARVGEDWSPEGAKWPPESTGTEGVTRNFADGQHNVTIRWLNPDPMADSRCRAPETGALASGVDYFQVISTGTYGGAKRKVEAIYRTYTLQVPRAYFTPGDIEVSGTAKIQQVSLFSGGNPDGTGGNITVAGGAELTGNDLNYGDWNDPPSDKFNKTGRKDSAGNPVTAAGLGAVKKITYNGNATNQLGTRDFDGQSSYTGPRFYKDLDPSTQTSSQITFPFNYKTQPDADSLCDSAKELGAPYYIKDTSTTSATKSLDTWPDNSNFSTVVCYEFTDTSSAHTLSWNVNGNTNLAAPYDGCKGPIKEGTLVVKGGNFSTKSNTALFRGVVVVRGPSGSESALGSSSDTGNTCLDGFVNATGPIKIAGTVRPSTSVDARNRPGFFGVRQWSWRELYE